MINIPKGTKDVLPQESYKWQVVEAAAREVCRRYNVQEIRTPVFEHTELFLRGIGDDTDVVSKEMYTFLDKGERSITLKPEGTASVARSYIENNLADCSLPLKMFYFTPVFRYERPQAGRLREHHQFGVEVYGGSGAEYDMEVIALAYDFLSGLGVTELTLNLNSIGCKSCRAEYNKALRAYLSEHEETLCPTCRVRQQKNPLRVLDCKVDSCQTIVANAPKILDFLCEDCRAHMDRLKLLLSEAGIPFSVNPGIVRGLDYYTRTVFEFVTTALGAQGTVCGGGRYDGLVESVGGKPTPCVGFGLGLERLILLIEALGIKFPDCTRPQIFVASQASSFADHARRLVYSLRRDGFSAEMDSTGRSLKSQMKFANKLNAKFAVVLGEEEIASGTVNLKNLSDGTQAEVKLDALAKMLQNQLQD